MSWDVVWGAALPYLNCVISIAMLYDFIGAMFPLRERWRKYRFAVLAGCALILRGINLFRSSTVNMIFAPLVLILFVWLVFQIQWKYNVLYVIFYFTLGVQIEFLFWQFYRLTNLPANGFETYGIFFLLIQDMALFLCVQLLKKNCRGMKLIEGYRQLKNLLLLPLTAIILESATVTHFGGIANSILISLSMCLLMAVHIMDFFKVERLLNTLSETKMIGLKTELEQSHYKRLEEVNQDYAGYMHEVRKMIRTMKELSVTEENPVVRELAAEILALKSPAVRKIYSEDRIVNAIFTEREKMALGAGIKFQVDIQPGLDLDFIKDTDKIIIFGNLLDNALEAAAEVSGGFVSAGLYMGNENLIVFRLENSFKHRIQKDAKGYLTTKDNKKEHGFGIRNLRETAETYNGMLNMTENDEVFTSMLLLSNMKKMER